jgi:hypothetical protein
LLMAPFLDQGETVHGYQVSVLAEYGARAKPAVPRLVKLLEGDEWSRIMATVALPKIDPSFTQKSIETLTRMLDDQAILNRHLVAQYLGDFGSAAASALPALRLLANSAADAQLRWFAAAAIDRIEQKNR